MTRKIVPWYHNTSFTGTKGLYGQARSLRQVFVELFKLTAYSGSH